MRRVNDKDFFNTWQMVYRSTCPSPTETHWKVGDVDWSKSRHSFFGGSYGNSTEVHVLRRSNGRTGSWSLMVVIENWWAGKSDPCRSSIWSKVVAGDAKSVVAWMRGVDIRETRAPNG